MARSMPLIGELAPLDVHTERLRLRWVDRPLAVALYEGSPSAPPTAAGFPGLDRPGAWSRDDPAELVAVERAADAVIIGVCPVQPVGDHSSTVEVSIGIARSARGQGYGLEALGAVLAWILEHMSVTAVIAFAYAGSEGERLIRRAGLIERPAGRTATGAWYELRRQDTTAATPPPPDGPP